MYKNKTYVICLALSICFTYSLSQDNIKIISDLESQKENCGDVTVVADSGINELISQHINHNAKLEGIPGYRIRIFSQTGNYAKDQMRMAKSIFLKMYPDIRAYEEYDQVNFKLYVGDFRSKNEALQLLHKIEESFPAAFIVSTNINYTPEKKETIHD